MNSFWPEGLSVSDIQSPYEILENAREEWETASDGVLTLVFQKSEPEDGIETIIVHVKHVPDNRTVTLFSVIHRLNSPYPITIQPKQDRLPKILKKSYCIPSKSSVFAMEMAKVDCEVNKTFGRPMSIKETQELITNKWVSDTPSEFREKLTEAFNLSVIKSAVLNLTSSASSEAQPDDDNNARQE
ncbi:MAG: hypothetical protein D3903_05535 [Candidatus Electrothrix sp. GM3_4]|nr:hypothetical protein [Candidatus Electrothrix sp. GM3_4]